LEHLTDYKEKILSCSELHEQILYSLPDLDPVGELSIISEVTEYLSQRGTLAEVSSDWEDLKADIIKILDQESLWENWCNAARQIEQPNPPASSAGKGRSGMFTSPSSTFGISSKKVYHEFEKVVKSRLDDEATLFAESEIGATRPVAAATIEHTTTPVKLTIKTLVAYMNFKQVPVMDEKRKSLGMCFRELVRWVDELSIQNGYEVRTWQYMSVILGRFFEKPKWSKPWKTVEEGQNSKTQTMAELLCAVLRVRGLVKSVATDLVYCQNVLDEGTDMDPKDVLGIMLDFKVRVAGHTTLLQILKDGDLLDSQDEQVDETIGWALLAIAKIVPTHEKKTLREKVAKLKKNRTMTPSIVMADIEKIIEDLTTELNADIKPGTEDKKRKLSVRRSRRNDRSSDDSQEDTRKSARQRRSRRRRKNDSDSDGEERTHKKSERK